MLTVTLTSAENLAPLSDGHLWACGVSGVERLLGRQRGDRDLHSQVGGVFGGRRVEREESHEASSSAKGDTASDTDAPGLNASTKRVIRKALVGEGRGR